MIKRILINIRQLQFRYSGVQSYIYNLTFSIVKQYPSIKFELATYNYNGGNEFIEKLRLFKNVTLLNTTGAKSTFFDIYFDHFKVNNLINNQDIYFNPVNITPVFKKKGVVYVVGVLDLCTFIVPKTTTHSLRFYYQLFLSSSLKRADKIIAISESTKKDIIKIFNTASSKISVIYLGVDEEICKAKTSHNSDKYFLTMATSRRKNIGNVIKSFAVFSKKNPKIKFKVVVNNPQISLEIEDLLTKFNLDKNKVQLEAEYISKEKLSRLYSEAIGFAYCPVYEGFGLPVLEAMKCGCPVITSTTSSLPEVAGNSAITVNPIKPLEIAKALSIIYSNKAKRSAMIKLGIKNVEGFSWANSATKLYNVLNTQ